MRITAILALCLLAAVYVAGDQCSDTISNCKAYGKSACLGKYKPWATTHCKKYCGYCSPGGYCTVFGKKQPVGVRVKTNCNFCTCTSTTKYFCVDVSCDHFDTPKGCSWIRASNNCCPTPHCPPGVKVPYPKGWKQT